MGVLDVKAVRSQYFSLRCYLRLSKVRQLSWIALQILSRCYYKTILVDKLILFV